MTKLIFISGSIRKESKNEQLAKLAFKIAANFDGVDAEYIDLRQYDMPIYNEDYESENGLPDSAKKLKKIFKESDGFFIASPEYNSSFSALLKNTLDWISRDGGENDVPLVAFNGKVAAISAASPGGLGGLRGLVPLRMMLSNIAVNVIPNQLAIADSYNAFDSEGNLKNDGQKSNLDKLVKQFVETSQKLKK